jgi:two-component system chemotaxis sensor kinase CheA
MSGFGSEFDDDILNDLIGGGESRHELRLVAVIDRHARELVQTFQSQNPTIQVTSAHYEDDVRIFLEDADMVLLECRILEGFKDLKLINAIRQIRPLIPIVAISSNMDSEFMVAAYETGVSDYISASTGPELLLAKLRTLHRMAEATRFLEAKNKEVVDTMQSLRHSKEKLKSEINSRINAETQKEFAQELATIHKQNKEILDNLREAFFIIKSDLTIAPTTSASCRTLFGRDLGRKVLGQCLGIRDDKESFLRLTLEQLFEDFMPTEVTLRMLPQQVTTVKGRILDLAYTLIRDQHHKPDRVIVVAADVTETVRQQQQYQKQLDVSQCLFSILQNRDAFLEFLADFKNDLATLRSSHHRETCMRVLHTIKGNSGVYNLDFLQKRIHAMETMVAQKKASDKAFFAFIQKAAQDIEDQMQTFLHRHQKILNIDFKDSRQDLFTMTGEQLQQLLHLARDAEKGMSKLLIKDLESLRSRPLSLLTAPLHNSVHRVAKKLGRDIEFTISGDDWRTDIEALSPLFRSLVHLVNNACDHGIEPPEDRMAAGKPARGQLRLSMTPDEAFGLKIVIEDDGSGIHADRILAVARQKKLLPELQLQRLAPEQIYGLIFLDGFSTSTAISQTSGRGVGMSAVKAEVEKLDGSIVIETQAGAGTRFILRIPGVPLIDQTGKAA